MVFCDLIKKIIQNNSYKTLLDYGSGKGDIYLNKTKYGDKVFPPLKDYWNVKPTLFDPGVIKFKKPKSKKFDITISVDVLEHIPPQDLYWVINEIFNFSNKAVFLNVACYAALKLLPNGQNAHVSIFSPEWWFGFIYSIAHNYDLKVFFSLHQKRFANKVS